MKKYFYLQLKRTAKIFPFILAVTLILFSGLTGIFIGMMHAQRSNEDVKKFKVGIVGGTDSSYFDFGLSLLQTFDDTRFSLELVQLKEAEARKALEKRDISVYFVFPEGFIEAALNGKMKTARLVTGAEDTGLVLIFKEEIAKAVTEIVTESQKGTYGVGAALDSNGYSQLSHKYLNKMNLEYIDFIVHRSELYSVTELGISDRLTLPAYFICSFAVFLLLLIGLPYAAVFIKKDWTLNRILAAGKCRAGKQVACEYLSYTLILSLLVTAIIAILLLLSKGIREAEMLQIDRYILTLVLYMIPVIITAAAFQMMLFELSGNIVNGILLQFFCTVSLCYVTGCFYPIYTFPKAVQLLASFLPTGLMRSCLASGITGQSPAADVIGMLAYTAAFLGITIAVRRHKITT